MGIEPLDLNWMHYAFTLAEKAKRQGEVPIGAVLIQDGEILGEGFNMPIASCDPTAHAEIQAIRAAAKQCSNYRLPGTTLYVTLEPCAMCAGAIIQSRIKRVVFGASDPRGGAAGSVFNILQNPFLNHRCEVKKGVLATECSEILTDFFREKRSLS